MKNPTGKIEIRLKKKQDGKTTLSKQHYVLPLQIMRPHYYDVDGTAFIYLMNPGGGVLQHDRFYTEIVAEGGSSTVVTTPSNTKFYKMDEGHAEVENKIVVEGDAIVEYLPEHNVPFAKAKVYQNNEFYVDEDSILLATDMVTEGRTSRGESFQYDLYSSKTKIYLNKKLLLLDSTIIEPQKMSVMDLGLMENHSSNGTFFVYAKNMDKNLKAEIEEIDSGVIIAATNVTPELMVVRMLGDNVIDMRKAMLDIWDICRRKIIGKKSVRIRKY